MMESLDGTERRDAGSRCRERCDCRETCLGWEQECVLGKQRSSTENGLCRIVKGLGMGTCDWWWEHVEGGRNGRG